MIRKSKLTDLELLNADLTNMDSNDKLNKNIDLKNSDLKNIVLGGNNLMQLDEHNQPESNTHLASRCGGALRLAREKSGLTIHDIASRLKISIKQIIAIESDDFAALPESTIVRGFIRNYAKLLKIDVEPILDAYKLIVPDKSPYAFAVKPASNMKVSQYEKPKIGRYIWGGFAVLVGLAAWLFYQNYVQKPNPSNPTEPVEIIQQLPQPALPAAERLELDVAPSNAVTDPNLSPSSANELNTNSVASVESTIVLPTPISSSAPTTTSGPTPETANVLSSGGFQLTTNVNAIGTSAGSALINAQPVKTQPATPLPSINAPLSTGSTLIEFNANKETWVSMVDATGRKVINKTIYANSRERFEVATPVNVTVGNATGLSMIVNNKAIDLAPHTRGNVARIKLD